MNFDALLWRKENERRVDSFLNLPIRRFLLSPAVHNVHFVKYDGPVVKMALYKLQGHIM